MTHSANYRYAWANGWRWVGWYLRHRRFLAALRQAWLAYVRGYTSEACQDCGRRYLLWRAPDELYSRVTGKVGIDGQSAPGLFCPACFHRRASEKVIELRWHPEEII